MDDGARTICWSQLWSGGDRSPSQVANRVRFRRYTIYSPTPTESATNTRLLSIVRASVGAMTTKQDVDKFLEFMRDAFIDHEQGDWTDSPRGTLYSANSEIMGIDVPGNYTYKPFPDVRELPRPVPLFPASHAVEPRLTAFPLALRDLATV